MEALVLIGISWRNVWSLDKNENVGLYYTLVTPLNSYSTVEEVSIGVFA